ncbi:MAG TPA: hypothetical protein DEP84_32965 [Chloroflexi bacterium]|nr:hypothetical protein [Chloroflexota bacterium]
MDGQLSELRQALVSGDIARSAALAKEVLAQGASPKAVLAEVGAAASAVGEKYEDGEYFLANLVRCGDSFKAVITAADPYLKAAGEGQEGRGRVVLATVEGDIHDIGKNLVLTFLQGDSFVVEDMGVNVSALALVDKAVEVGADIIALSCLMSVTRDGVKKVCSELEARGLRDRFAVLVGGAATNERWAKQIGCDAWASSATEGTRVARTLVTIRAEA